MLNQFQLTSPARDATWSPEAYVNMDIRNTVKNAALAAEFASLDELGQDVILVSSHAGARKKCYPYQGKFFSRSGKTGTIKDGNGKEYPYSPLSDTSFGEPDGLFGINCGHRMRGVSDGLFIYREKQYDEKENSEEYEKVCKQRQMERKIRKDRRTRDALEAAGDTEGAKELRRKIAEENKQLKEYCDREGLNYRQDRTRTYGYSDESRKKKPVDLVESVDKSGESGIINKKVSDHIMSIYNETDDVYDFIEIEKEMLSTPIGKNIAEYIETEGLNITINYDTNAPANLCGGIVGKEITVYAVNHNDIKELVDTIVHETAHRKYNWNTTQEDEVNCRILEILRTKKSISNAEISDVVSFVRNNYSEMPTGDLYGY
ncbi:MAG: phage minor capsid protein [Ruminiclostridium sp.]